jgi:hypothetical protein
MFGVENVISNRNKLIVFVIDDVVDMTAIKLKG